ncbi:MAG: gamma-glutamylcyclotransferase [Acidobacteriota bacterium]|nr:gamma-glutamylcyclotransferase [Acidobacteriota bacterium]
MYYFAYASNMNHALMKERCPGGRFLRKAKLPGYRFVYDGYSPETQGSVGNAVRSETESVLGALFEIMESDRLGLDGFEGRPGFYDRKEIEVMDDEGTVYKALAFLRTPRPLGKPHPRYEKLVLEGAKDCRLPDEYMDQYLRVKRL